MWQPASELFADDIWYYDKQELQTNTLSYILAQYQSRADLWLSLFQCVIRYELVSQHLRLLNLDTGK